MLFRLLFAAPRALVTTALVIAEGHAWSPRRFDRARALQFDSCWSKDFQLGLTGILLVIDEH